MAKKTKKVVKVKSPGRSTEQSAGEIAALLGEVRARMNEDEKLNKVLTSAFKDALRREGLVRAGNYKLNKSTSFKVVTEELALSFALERNLVRIDTAKAHQVFNLDETLRFEDPLKYGFEEVVSERVDPLTKSKME